MAKRLGYEAVHPLLASAEVKKAYSFIAGSLNPN